MVIRIASPEDADRLVPLFLQLGYPSAVHQIRSRLDRNQIPDYVSWVFEDDQDSGVIGFAGGHLLLPYEDDHAAAQLMILVVHPLHREAGVGAALVKAFESWAIAAGASRCIVSSGLERQAAHDFYGRQGYDRTGVRFGKQL